MVNLRLHVLNRPRDWEAFGESLISSVDDLLGNDGLLADNKIIQGLARAAQIEEF